MTGRQNPVLIFWLAVNVRFRDFCSSDTTSYHLDSITFVLYLLMYNTKLTLQFAEILQQSF